MKVKVWSSPSKSYEVVLPRTVDLSSQGVPSQLYVEGVAASDAMRDVTLKLSYIYNTATLHADPVKLTVVEADLDIAGLSDAEEEDPGGDCIVNSDDDNQNGIADREETGTVYGENELKQVTLAIRPANLNRGEVKLQATGGLGKYKLWESASKGTEVSLPRTWNLLSQSPPSSLWVEGIEASDSVADIPFRLSHHLEGRTIHEDRANFTVFDIGPPGGGGMLMGGGIDSVWWAEVSSGLDTNPNPGGGWRIFPGKQNPTDPTARDTVKVSAQLQPEAGNRTIHFKAYDVDDPSADSPPIDDESKAADNNGGAGHFPNQQAQDSAITNSSGVAELIFTVTMRPGDNFRVVASLTTQYFNHIRPRQGDSAGRIESAYEPGNFIPDKYQTAMLTVWRKLHFELDKMAAPARGSGHLFGWTTGTVTGWNRPANNELEDENANWLLGDLIGAVVTLPQPGYSVTPSPHTNAEWTETEISFVVTGNTATVLTLDTDYTDDEFDNDDDGQTDEADEVWNTSMFGTTLPEYNLNTDDAVPALRPPLFNEDKFNDTLNPAYVVVHHQDDTVTDHPFRRNWNNDDGNTWPIRDVPEGSDFVVVHVTGCYDGPITKNIEGDNDPDAEHGNVAGYTPEEEWGDDLSSMVFIEYHDDIERSGELQALGLNRNETEQQTVLHEALHQLPFDLSCPVPNTIMGGIGDTRWEINPGQIIQVREKF